MGAALTIEAQGLVKSFGHVEALAGIDLSVAAGTVLGLLGPNGAGKTTVVRILATLLPADAGHATVMGFDVARQPGRVTRSAVLAGRTAADAVRNLFVLALMTGVAYAIGFRFHAGPTAALGAIGLALLIGVAFSWIFALLGLLVHDSESAGIGGLLAVIPLVFTSSTFVPVATFPGWLQAFAKINPITVTVDAVRVLCLGGPTADHVWQALAWIGALLALTVPVAVSRYRHTTST